MADPITMRVLTGAGITLEDHAMSVIAPGERGYLGFLRNHAPLVTTLVPGKLRWRLADGTRHEARISSGLLEIVNNRLTILTDALTFVSPPGR